MNRLFTSLVVPAALVAAVSIPASAAAPSMTADQRLVAGLEQARSAARETLGGKPALQKVIAGMRSARTAAPSAVGALEIPTVRAVLRQGEPLARRLKLRRLIALTSAALDDFGVPLEKDFASFVTTRGPVSPTGAPLISKEQKEVAGKDAYTGVSAVVGREITQVVIGAADRRTANAGEPGAASSTSRGLPITVMGHAFLVDSAGQYTSQVCTLKSGLITCRLRSPMPADRTFMIALGPMLPKGTRLLVKFRSPRSDRSYAVGTVP